MSVVSLSLTGLLQIHIPFVHGLVVGPIANPSILKKISAFQLLNSIVTIYENDTCLGNGLLRMICPYVEVQLCKALQSRKWKV